MARRSYLLSFLIPVLAAVAAAPAGQTLPDESPFLPPPTATAPAAVDSAAGYQLSGMTVVGTDTLLGITRESDKRSNWIAVGQTLAEITVVSYDAAKEQAVIRVNGQEHTLAMPRSAVVGVAVSPLIPANTAGALPGIQAPVTAEPAPLTMPPLSLREEKEMEARMLVTDLLEIGQRQRKAYAEAQRQAAQKAAEAGRAAPESPKK